MMPSLPSLPGLTCATQRSKLDAQLKYERDTQLPKLAAALEDKQASHAADKKELEGLKVTGWGGVRAWRA